MRLKGNSAHEYGEQIEEMRPTLAYGWQTKPSGKTGNPVYVRPSVLVIYREDHKFLLDGVIPQPGRVFENYDLILASQPWRARMSAQFKAPKVLAPLTRSLAPGGRLLAIQSYGHDPALEIIQKLWPGENPFQVDRHELLAALQAPSWARRARFHHRRRRPTTRRCFATKCTRCRRRSPTASARRRCSPPGMRRST